MPAKAGILTQQCEHTIDHCGQFLQAWLQFPAYLIAQKNILVPLLTSHLLCPGLLVTSHFLRSY